MYANFDRMAAALARLMAYSGGAILVALVIATCVSIIGRALAPLGVGIGPILGIYDLTEIGIAATICAFLPWCQYTRGHASVDLLQPVLPTLVNRLLDLVIDFGMLIIAAIGAHRMYLGMRDKLAYGDTSQVMQFPLWIAYLAALIGLIAFTFISAFCVARSTRGLLQRKEVNA